jgi:hypothetical protein
MKETSIYLDPEVARPLGRRSCLTWAHHVFALASVPRLTTQLPPATPSYRDTSLIVLGTPSQWRSSIACDGNHEMVGARMVRSEELVRTTWSSLPSTISS